MRIIRVACLLIVWGVTITIVRPTNVYAACITSSPQNIPGAIAPPVIENQLLVNEVLPTPNTVWNCQQPSSANPALHAWIEIYNPQNQNYDLSLVHASLDNGPNTQRFLFPDGSSIAAQSFLVVFPGNAYITTGDNLQIRLLFNDQVIQNVSIPGLPVNFSYSRQPDGNAVWQATEHPTIQASNNSSVLATATAAPSPSITNTTTATPTSNDKKPVSTPTSSPTSVADPKPVFGQQPTWQSLSTNNLQAETTDTQVNNQANTTNDLAPIDATLPLWLKIAMSGFFMLLIGGVFWTIKRFFFPGYRWRQLKHSPEDNSP